MLMKLERDKYIKIREGTYLCHVKVWGKEEYIYAVGMTYDFKDYRSSTELNIWGYGENAADALIMSVNHLSKYASNSFYADDLNDITVFDFSMSLVEMMSSGPKKDVPNLIELEHPEHGKFSMAIFIENDTAFPLAR